MPLISIVIPTYNHSIYLKKALTSVINQTFENWEVIVVDNYSSDDTSKIINTYNDPRIKYIKNHNNGVIANSRNNGIKFAKGEWIAFLDSDDWWKPEKLKTCVDFFNNQVDLIHHDLKIISNKSHFFERKAFKSRQLKKPILIDLLVNGNLITNSSVVVRRKMLKNIGLINEDPKLIAAEDYNTWLKISKLTDQFLYIPKKLGYYLIHDHNISSKNMSIPTYHAAYEYLYKLNVKQRIKFDSRIKYTAGRYDYLLGEYLKARKNLLFSLRYGQALIKIKSAIMLILGFLNKWIKN
jgi:glycosyltransferase involved in cell wall biosynthesis